jgi:hypothetical protein
MDVHRFPTVETVGYGSYTGYADEAEDLQGPDSVRVSALICVICG